MGDNKRVLITFDKEFFACVERLAERQHITMSNFIRRAVSGYAIDSVKNFPEGLFNEKDLEALKRWENKKGGDYSAVRAAKDKNYKKKSLAEKIDEAKELLNKLEKGKRENE